MACPCHVHVMSMSCSYPCYVHVMSISWPCSCDIHVMSMWCPCPIHFHVHVMFMSYLYHVHVMSILCPCHVHVMSMSYPYSCLIYMDSARGESLAPRTRRSLDVGRAASRHSTQHSPYNWQTVLVGQGKQGRATGGPRFSSSNEKLIECSVNL